MNSRTILFVITAGLSIAAFAGCDGDGNSTNNGGSAGAGNGGSGGTGGAGAAGGTGGAGGQPAVPTLGAQIDRMGRPAINTALNHTFELITETKDAEKDKWNQNSDPATWTTYAGEIGKNLAVLDGVDTMCGNQLLADPAKMDATRYATLAGVLADDRLYVNTDGAGCTTYLAVEANAVGVMNNDCGGRRLSYDVIDVSYTVLVAGKLDASIGDTIPISDAAKGEIFPHLADPH